MVNDVKIHSLLNDIHNEVYSENNTHDTYEKERLNKERLSLQAQQLKGINKSQNSDNKETPAEKRYRAKALESFEQSDSLLDRRFRNRHEGRNERQLPLQERNRQRTLADIIRYRNREQNQRSL